MTNIMKIWICILLAAAIFSTQFTHLSAYDTQGDISCENDFSLCDSSAEPASCASCPRFGASVDFLWWQLRRPQSYTSKGFSTSSDVTSFSRTEPEYVSFDYDPGFRVGLFAYDTCHCFDVGVIWTHFETHAKADKRVQLPEELFVELDVTRADASIKVRLNYVDLDFSKKLCLMPCFVVTPHIGVRGLWLDYHQRVRGVGFIEDFDTNRVALRKQKFKDVGYGIEGGFWMQWNMNCGLSLVGHLGGSVLSIEDKYHSGRRVIQVDDTNVVTDDEIDLYKSAFKSGTTTFDYYIGLQYNYTVCGYDILFKAGWESFFVDFDSFHFQGLTTGLSVNF
jgi:hypothetical protein